MSKHTPGPWEWTYRGLYAGNKPVLVPHYEYGEPTIRSRDADDVLIAAAPDLLVALQNLTDALVTQDAANGWWSPVCEAYQAIAKATGETP